ncbi:serine hydrolase domain-containing protein [Paracraurococcus lichenis]|uniref:Serine hydrolase domain-containing protein n=1 Tax=Paracraurococcus lichenis TaxID=3064888 RepID=A0ABT9E986_9PROT|nr:serine hydrolase domain-containing protein [Paracraurococcus sp. LOR1-02]MDO9712750.1 serine hydrolase domain-containing protein [Paracraurococcus sp. LOR1-02]
MSKVSHYAGMDTRLNRAIAYIQRWTEFQTRLRRQPGCAVSVVQGGRVLLEAAFGVADVATGESLTPRHRFRVASHSKAFTAAGILLLRERGALRLDDPAGQFVSNLHSAVASTTLGQLLAHAAGLPRDGVDGGAAFTDRRPFADAAGLLADLALPPPLEAGLRFKYSNHGYGLLGLVIEAATGEPYTAWIGREVVAAAGLEETSADISYVPEGVPLARGHSAELPLGRRLVIPGDNPTGALAPATGFVATASDMARFFGQLAPGATTSILSVSSRRELVHRRWRDENASVERYYGYGVVAGPPGEWEFFGHPGSFQGSLSRTVVMPEQDLAVSVLTNAVDGFAWLWVDGIVHILKTLCDGVPGAEAADWSGQWWSLWGAIDLVPAGDARVLMANPAVLTPFLDASELEVTGPDTARVVRAGGFERYGEAVQRVRAEDGEVCALRIGGTILVTEAALARELIERYAGSSGPT